MPNDSKTPVDSTARAASAMTDDDMIRHTALTLLAKGLPWGVNAVQKAMGGRGTDKVSTVIRKLKEDLAKNGQPVMPDNCPPSVTEAMGALWVAANEVASSDFAVERGQLKASVETLTKDIDKAEQEAANQALRLDELTQQLSDELAGAAEEEQALTAKLNESKQALALAHNEKQTLETQLRTALAALESHKAQALEAIAAKDAAVKAGADALAESIKEAKADLAALTKEERERATEQVNRAYEKVEEGQKHFMVANEKWEQEKVAISDKLSAVIDAKGELTREVSELKAKLDAAIESKAGAEKANAKQIQLLEEQVAELKKDKADALAREAEATKARDKKPPSPSQ